MASKNFEFLRTQWKELATLGSFAEQYAFPDPSSCLVKLRTFSEQVVDYIYHVHGLTKGYSWQFVDLLNDTSFKQAVDPTTIDKLHSLRKNGNKGAHGNQAGKSLAVLMLEEAYDIACWLHLVYANGKQEDCGHFELPVRPTDDSKGELKREKKELLQRVASQEAELKRLLEEIELTRSEATKSKATEEQLSAALENSKSAASTLSFDELTTRRRLIDVELESAGWDIGANGKDTEEIKQEMKVLHQPTPSGTGLADYVLFGENGFPLAVIEAKKTSKDPAAGRQQAKCYADGLKKEYGRRPIIFYTNGYETTIWNDAMDEPPRRIYGMYSKDSLEYLMFQRPAIQETDPQVTEFNAAEPAQAEFKSKSGLGKKAPNEIIVDEGQRIIAGRMFQMEAVKRVIERFSQKQRKALIVQATGTGKTRVAVALCEALSRARWAKRVLFLCDRRELRKQAKDVFNEFMPDEPLTYVTSKTYKDRENRIYLATYPAMMKVYGSFDVGFFDLVIADESHRSIYNRYRDLFLYFDAYQVGLTATPVEFISRNTFELFACDDRDPTVFFSYEDAVGHTPPYLVPFRVFRHTTDFLRRGIKYSQMTAEQREQLEEQEVQPDAIEHEQHEVDRVVFNKDTNRHILRNLMDHGIKVKDGNLLGKTIIFARNHEHAKLLGNLFDELFPQYGGKFCRVIDHYEPRAEDLIDELKQPDSPLRIAISVDMLDTGIDIPEVVNLVFAKPVYSKVKFWQMIGRGTRLCKSLLAPGKDKQEFYIFDHWGNFEYFDEKYREVELSTSKSLLQTLFEARITLADTALQKAEVPSFDLAVELLFKDIHDLPEQAISIQEKYKQVQQAKQEDTLKQFDPATQRLLLQDIAPLMEERHVQGLDAYKFDRLICRMQTEYLKNSPRFDDLKAELLGEIDLLRMNLSQVKAQAASIQKVRSKTFWDSVTVASLEEVRHELRGIMRHKMDSSAGQIPKKVLDIKEEDELVERDEYQPKIEAIQMAAYRERVNKALTGLIDSNETLQRIKAGKAVAEEELTALTSMVLTQYPGLDLNDLLDYYPEVAGHLDLAIRSIIGLDGAAVNDQFCEFVQNHNLTSTQIKFLDLLQNHIARYGTIEIDRLYEAPFTTFDSNGIEGVFNDQEIDDILEILGSFQPPDQEE